VTAGLPGSGIGGLYYLLLALWMPFHGLWLRLRGRGSRLRWILVAKQSCMAAGILCVLWGEGWLLKRLLVWIVWHTPSASYWHMTGLTAWVLLAPIAAARISFGILAGVILMTHVVSLWVRWAPSQRGHRAGRPGMPPLHLQEPRAQRQPDPSRPARFIPDGRASGTA